jgi:hypothetical protein
MTVFSDLDTVLKATGYKVFANKKLDSVKTAIVYKSISQKIVGSMSGYAGIKIERVQISCFAIAQATLVTMEKAVEDALAYYNASAFTSIPTESKIEGFETGTSTFYCFRDYMIIYKEI